MTHSSEENRFEYFFRAHYADLCRTTYRITRDQSVCEDIVQEVFLRVWKNRSRLSFDEQFLHYLKKSCYHNALKFLASDPKFQGLSDASLIRNNEESDDRIRQAQLHESVRSGIASLPEKTALIFTLSRYEGLSNREISIQLNLSVKAVEKHMTKALRLLRVYLKDYLILAILLCQ